MPFHYSEESKVTLPFHDAKRSRKPQSEEQQVSQKKKKNCDTETEDKATSDIEFEVGGTIKSSRYKHIYSSTFPITFKE